MSYESQQQLSVDSAFLGRNWSALCTEARAKPAGDGQAAAVLADPWAGVTRFMPYIATAPGFGDLYEQPGGQANITDADLLSAVQAAWPLVAVPA